MAAVPSGGSLVATHDYYRCRLGSTSSSSPCGSRLPRGRHPAAPGLPKADPGHWWASCFFGESTLLSVARLLESPERPDAPQAASSVTSGGQARGAAREQPEGLPGWARPGPRF